MAGEDTEKSQDPSQKRLQEAHDRGDVVKSQEVSSWFVMAGATLIVIAFSGTASGGIMTTLRGLIAHSYDIRVDGPGFIDVIARLGREVIAATALPLSLLMLAALAGNLIQHRLVWSAEGLKPKFSKISPKAGLGRLVSKQALVNFGKGLAKLGLLGAVIGSLLWPERFRLEGLVTIDPAAILPVVHVLTVKMLGAVVAILMVIAAMDYFFQYRQWFERQKMSLAELKEEFRQTDGDPAVKGKIRQIRQNRMRKRMMAAVPTASVVITNPTHFAVALRYERGMNAPICVAKGADLIALKIREVAREHGIPIVENAPLARAVYATAEIDQEIQPEHYKAVAEVIGYIMRLNRTFAGRRQ
jgi:flagellar biosynthetic protein FlhB